MNQYIENVTIGTDPELFIVNTKTKSVVSSIGLIPGKKREAFLPEGFEKGFGLQTDNVLAEFNIPPVTVGKDGKGIFTSHIAKMKDYIENFVKSVNSDLGILCSASELVPEDQLQSDEAKQFGCEPDYNFYTLSQNEAPAGTKTNLRTTGVHVHVGYENPNLTSSIGILKVMDLFLGVPSVLMDADTRRRSLYGKAGCFRLTDYGLEYRVLSGHFIKDAVTTDWVYQQTVKAINFFNSSLQDYNSKMQKSPFAIEKYLPAEEVVCDIINNGNKTAARRLVKKYEISLI